MPTPAAAVAERASRRWRWAAAVALVVFAGAAEVRAHGRLVEPPSRASAWRFGFDTPHNYNDHELYCGGFSRQWHKNGGKCGVCGDAWDQPAPRPHELGGRFGQGVIVRRYPTASVVTVKIELTASHNGYFEFRICQEPKGTTQECLDENVLVVNGSKREETRFYPRDGNKMYEMKYRLPADMTCEHCVMQWRYTAGNNWGTCANGTGAVGCGPQEEFRACADISIGDHFTTTTRRPRPSYVPPSRRPSLPRPEDASDEGSGGAWVAALVAAVALLCAVALFAVLYLYYYRGGERIKSLLASRSTPRPAAAAPVAPPRQKRNSLARETVPPLGPHKLQYAEPGFETVDLRGK